MALTTSVISLLVLLLATYCYSVPIQPLVASSTPDYAFTTGKTVVDHGNHFNMQLISDEESTGVPNIHKPRSDDEHDNGEFTTEFPIKQQNVVRPSHTFMGEHSAERTTEFPVKQQNVDRPSRTFMGQDSVERTTEFSSSSDETNDKRGLSDFLLTTLESSTDFEQRAIRNNGTEPEIVSVTRAVSENEVDTTTDIEPSFSSSSSSSETESESSSSVNSFGKATGLLHDDKLEAFSTTAGSEKHEQSVEESTTRFLPIQNQRLTKTVQIIPGKVVETKIYANAPSRTYVVPQRNQQIQLSQGEKQPIIEKEESNN